jgi:hypothetical protein
VWQLLQGYRSSPPAKIEAVVEVLIRLGQLAADHPGIRELDINPLLADAAGVVALDARLRIAPARIGPDRSGETIVSIAGPRVRILSSAESDDKPVPRGVERIGATRVDTWVLGLSRLGREPRHRYACCGSRYANRA